MFELVIGGASSGKSEYAERRALSLASETKASSLTEKGSILPKATEEKAASPALDERNLSVSSENPSLELVYIATMASGDEESLRRISAHQKRRSGKGFRTIERPTDIQGMGRLREDEKAGGVVLLEDLSNLLANELFGMGAGSDVQDRDRHAVGSAILQGIKKLLKESSHLIIVTNDIFEDSGSYEGMMLDFFDILGRLNKELAAMADMVTEIVYGIPLAIKDVSPDTLCNYGTESYMADMDSMKLIKPYDKMQSECSAECGWTLILIVGGFCQGKTAFAQEIIRSEDKGEAGGSEAADKKRSILLVDDLHEMIRRDMIAGGRGAETAQQILKNKRPTVIVSSMPGEGPVPVDAFERRWRDEVGKACQMIARRADRVYRVVCGIALQLK